MLSLEHASFDRLEGELKSFLGGRLKGLRLQSMSVVDGRVNLQYQYRQQAGLDWTAFANELNRVTEPDRVELFVG